MLKTAAQTADWSPHLHRSRPRPPVLRTGKCRKPSLLKNPTHKQRCLIQQTLVMRGA
jgi:hypothetical protein